ncbi:MAG: hypothetical protein SF051_14960 [Elusimicrobiota bacterium]|nr:hypothetical protein [Elusimicrobiota bacterium]
MGIRLNTNDGSSQVVPLPIVTSGANKTVFFHKDESVDIAVIPVHLDHVKFQHKYIPVEWLLPTDRESKLKEGMEVFFQGLFTPYLGYRRNSPITRFGRIALLTDEKIQFTQNAPPQRLHLLEMASFGGNSGSPVFLLGDPAQAGTVVISVRPKIYLIGVMKGTYRDVNRLIAIETAVTPASLSSMGIAAVVPSQYLSEIIYSKELKNSRRNGT